MRISPAFTILAALVPACAIAATAQNDLREIGIGMPVSALPSSGYGGFACEDNQAIKLPDWNAYRSCPASADGTHAISFRYDDASGETKVAGQPVQLALLIDKESNVSGIKINTDPNARLYLHKKAFLFALQVRARFGEDGWTCTQQSPTPTKQPVGGVFIHEHCEKTTPSRHLVLERELFRDPAKDLREFTNGTQLTILRAGPK